MSSPHSTNLLSAVAAGAGLIVAGVFYKTYSKSTPELEGKRQWDSALAGACFGSGLFHAATGNPTGSFVTFAAFWYLHTLRLDAQDKYDREHRVSDDKRD